MIIGFLGRIIYREVSLSLKFRVSDSTIRVWDFGVQVERWLSRKFLGLHRDSAVVSGYGDNIGVSTGQ